MKANRILIAAGMSFATLFAFSCSETGNNEEPQPNFNLKTEISSDSSENTSSSSEEPSSSSEEPSSSSEEQSSSSATCGGNDYEPQTQFCFGNAVYSKCGDKSGNGKHEYEPQTQFCHNNYTVDKCGGLTYAPPNEQCAYGFIEKKCGGGWYEPQTQFCSGSVVYDKCGGHEYSPANERCINDVLETKCGTSWYNASDANLRCENSVLYAKCGSTYWVPVSSENTRCRDNAVPEVRCGDKWYIPVSGMQQCGAGNVIETRCGGSNWYDASNANLRCGENGFVETKCGTSWYNASNANLRCQSNVVETKCGTSWYNASNANLRCKSNVIETKCGVNWYDASKSNLRCEEGVVYNSPITYGGQTYKTVLIGTQTWMAENLNIEASGSKCYNNENINCAKYGRLYNWATAKTVCPSGWHLPSDDEWNVLTAAVGGAPTGGKHLKTKTGWNNNGNGENTYGFSALPGGYGSGTSFNGVGNSGFWWSSTEGNSSYAYYRYMLYNYSEVSRYYDDKASLFSVRCLQD